GEVSFDDFSGGNTMTAREIKTLIKARETYAKGVVVNVPAEQLSTKWLNQLEQVLVPHQGGACPVFLDYQGADFDVRFRLGQQWLVIPSDECMHDLQNLMSEHQVTLEF